MLNVSWRRMQPVVLAAIPVLAVQTLFWAGHANAAILYEDMFSRGTTGTPTALSGSTPAPTDTGSATWTESHYSGSALTTDGSTVVAPAAGVTVAALPFKPAVNTIYTLTVTLAPSSTGSWLAIGLGNTSVIGTAGITDSSTEAWLAYRTNGAMTTWYGGGTNNGLTTNGGLNHLTTDTFTITFNTGTKTVVFSDSLGYLSRSVTLTDAEINGINAILIGSYNTAGTIDNLELSNNAPAVPEPASMTLLTLGGGALLMGRRKRS